jgi:hypothetical protein
MQKRTVILLALLGLPLVLLLVAVPPIAQDPAYHLLADARTFLSIPSFLNVASNIAFVLVGAIGLAGCVSRSRPGAGAAYAWLVFFLGTLLVGFGSAYYHSAPNDAGLVWDRLPMTIAFMALFYLLLSERVFRSSHRYALWLLVAVGIGAALYWDWTESLGRGDLRPYALVQFLPIALTPLILCLFKPRYLSNSALIGAMGFYVLAKLLEQFDAQVFAATNMSGHALKHVAAAAAVLCIVYAVPTRHPVGNLARHRPRN